MKTRKEPRIKSARRPTSHRQWQVQEAKAKFSQLLNETISSGYQKITKNGEPVAYLVSKEEFDVLLKPEKSILDTFDQCPYPEVDLNKTRNIEHMRESDL